MKTLIGRLEKLFFSVARRRAEPRVSASRREHGVALVLTLLLMGLISLLCFMMMVSVSSDLMINGFYRNYRGSFYAADSGLNVARQQLVNQVIAAIPATYTTGTLPISAATAATALSYIQTTYATNTSLNAGQAAQSWQEGFTISNVTFACATGCSGAGVIVSNNPTTYQFVFSYSLTSVGQAQGSEQASVSESGNVTVNVPVVPAAGATTSFANWGMFIDQQPLCSGSYLVPGTISGPVFTNGGWTFSTTGAYIFTDQVGSANADAGFQFGSCYTSTAGLYKSGSQTISPTYQNGFKWGQNTVPLPANDFSQKWAVLDGKGMGEGSSSPTGANMNSTLKTIAGTAYPSSGTPSSGVYIPYTSISGTNTVTGGGIYVENNATIQLSIGTDSTSSHNPTQIFTITQGSTTTTVTTNIAANSTTVKSGSTTLTLAGVPSNLNGSTPQPGTLIYVDGSVTALSGPGQGSPAIQDGAGITITAKNDITITGDILYKSEPVTQTQNQIPNTPADTLIPGNDHGQALGLFTASGNVYLNNQQSNGNLEIDASIATISSGGSGGLVNNSNAINTLIIVGGRIQSTIQNINTTTRNVFFDRRYTNDPGFAPPFFPSTTVTPVNTMDTDPPVASVQRVQWANTTAMQ